MGLHRYSARRAAGLAAVALATTGAAWGQVAALPARALAATCASCHGTDGKAAAGTPLPPLAGLPRDYFVAQMQAFQQGKRPATVMHQIAKGYSPEQIETLAAYFAARP